VNRDGMDVVIDMLLARWFRKDYRAANPTTVAEVTRILLANDAQGYARTCAAIALIDFSKSNRSIKCPTLVIAGAHDDATPPALSDAIAASIGGARLVSVEAAHISAVELPQTFVALVSSHLQKEM
jgi:3-oxoadipate enol-lactonase